MKTFRITVRDVRFDGNNGNNTAYSEIVECPESALEDMALCVAQDRFGFDEKVLQNIGFSCLELPAA